MFLSHRTSNVSLHFIPGSNTVWHIPIDLPISLNYRPKRLKACSLGDEDDLLYQSSLSHTPHVMRH
uniref:Putative ovule protein n=1 Tax=Solanum chacoense TaxID=4108 RepID=A0A0V0HA02_SOLCH